MKSCLIEPLGVILDFEEKVKIPLGLLVLGSILEANGHEVKIVDFSLITQRKRLKADNNFYLNAARIIANSEADILGFTSMCNSYPVALGIAQECKKNNPEYKVIFGGPQATFVDVETLKNFPFVDIIVRGEGEVTIAELMYKLERKETLRGVKGITYREGNKIIRNEDRELIRDLDTLPFPAYHLISVEEYWGKNSKEFVLPIETGRGCPFNCIFCSSALMWQRRFRLKSPERILQEIRLLKQKYKIKTFNLIHDTFTVNKLTTVKFCTLLAKSQLHIEWQCTTRVDCVDADLLARMSESGCRRIFYGIESGSAKIQENIEKKLNLQNALEVIKNTAEKGIAPVVSFIIGFPEGTIADLNNNLKFAIECISVGARGFGLHILAPLCGTTLFKRYKDKLLFTNCISNVSLLWPIKILKNRIRWIKRYPEIFSSFYNIKPTNLSIKLLFEIQEVFFQFSHLFIVEKDFLIIYKKLKLQPLDLFWEWKKWVKKEKKVKNICGIKKEKTLGYFIEFLIKKKIRA